MSVPGGIDWTAWQVWRKHENLGWRRSTTRWWQATSESARLRNVHTICWTHMQSFFNLFTTRLQEFEILSVQNYFVRFFSDFRILPVPELQQISYNCWKRLHLVFVQMVYKKSKLFLIFRRVFVLIYFDSPISIPVGSLRQPRQTRRWLPAVSAPSWSSPLPPTRRITLFESQHHFLRILCN